MDHGHTVYDYGGVDTAGGLGDRQADEGADRAVVVVDGTAMRYREYCQEE